MNLQRVVGNLMRRSREMLGAVSVAVAASWASACRDAPAPYDPGEPPAPEAVRRITWDQRDDRAPVWTADGERIVYVRGNVLSAFSDLPTLLEIPHAGGTRTLLFPDLQNEEGLGGRPLTAPAVDPRSTRLMFVQRFQLAPPAGC